MFIKIGVDLQLCSKETPAQVFSCEYCELFKKSFSYRTPLVAASANKILSLFTGNMRSLKETIISIKFNDHNF